MSQSPLVPAQAEKLGAIKTSTERALGLIDDILDFSRLESAKLSLKIREFDLLQTVETSLELVSILAARKHLDLAFTIEKNIPVMLLGDPPAWGRCSCKLITIKFCDSGHILVSSCATASDRHRTLAPPKWALFAVSDTGISIPAAAQRDSSTVQPGGSPISPA
jgi:signal transduction histidine kinase